MIKTAVIGASGYTGLELIKILLTHPNFELFYASVTKDAKDLIDIHPSLKNITNIKTKNIDIKEINNTCQLVFLATPHGASMQYVSKLNKDIKIVDLSADYRLKLDTYQKHYIAHCDIPNLKKAVYGLPEFYRDEIKKTNLVANPGCYPTASLLAILPFVKYLDETKDIIIDAKSATSGAGKSPTDMKHFVSVNESILVYNPLSHRHQPEIQEKVQNANCNINIHFTPTLLPITRGMQCNVYMYVKEDIDPQEILKICYKNEYFIRIYDEPVSMKNVCGTNFCDIFATKKDKMIFVSASIDNLLRGASSQAIVNANILFDLPELTGVPQISYMP